ncbi:restriction endonuclease subunit S [Chryseobacterium sp. NEB161]|nr:restriction endonuclease subunit S [Chryseobacterium sp. NEB161]
MSNSRKVDSILTYYGKGVTPNYVEDSSIIVLNQKCIRHNKIDYSFAQYINDQKKYNEEKYLKVGDILINSTGQGTAGRVAFVDKLPTGKKVITDSHILVVRTENYFESKCLNYSLFSIEKQLQTFMDGSTGQGEFDKQRLFNVIVNYSKENSVQQKIANILKDIDNKIELNDKLNDNLEQMAKTLYDYWFVQFDFPNENGKPYKSSGGKMVFNEVVKREIPEGWEVKSLYDIAEFINGLACQKYRPLNENEDYLAVIKIKEMNDGLSQNTEKVTVDIPEKHKIYDGDVLFSWSATLDVKIWSLGKGALNQHIFKVTSSKYPKYFYFFEISNYLQHFKMMAELRKTTMGHITKDHLIESRISVPPLKIITELEKIIDPYLENILTNRKQNQQLSDLRDWLLPMLMNGQVKVE